MWTWIELIFNDNWLIVLQSKLHVFLLVHLDFPRREWQAFIIRFDKHKKSEEVEYYLLVYSRFDQRQHEMQIIYSLCLLCGSFNANLFVYGSNHSTEYQHTVFKSYLFQNRLFFRCWCKDFVFKIEINFTSEKSILISKSSNPLTFVQM